MNYKSKLGKTNKIWNEVNLNSPFSVGYVSSLINKESFRSYQEWKEYYYKSGQKRREIISTLPLKEQLILLDTTLSYEEVNKLPKRLKDINFNYGRTREELNQKGMILHGVCLGKGINDVGISESIQLVEHRVLLDTYNGIVKTERNTVKRLRQLNNELDYKAIEGEEDIGYGVDYEIYKGETLVGAIQIKPVSYKGNTSYLRAAKQSNKVKNEQYRKDKGVEVQYVYSDRNGKIDNLKEVYNYIAKIG